MGGGQIHVGSFFPSLQQGAGRLTAWQERDEHWRRRDWQAWRPPDKLLGPRSQRVGFEKVDGPKGGEARISMRRECNLKAAVGREQHLKVQIPGEPQAGFCSKKTISSLRGYSHKAA